jgi:uncharacterized protein (TIGR02646 family)
MRYINNQQLQTKLPTNWQTKVERKLNKIKGMTPNDRRNAIASPSSSNIWSELKDALAELSHGKCWYCETRISRSDKEVDHYRPKNAVWECSDHPGYWWLAFDWKNFRLSCSFCNQYRNSEATPANRQAIKTGKGTQFPLLDEARRVFEECEAFALVKERPILLDPTVPTDPRLLTFDIDGMAKPAKSENYPDDHQRARDSIIIYHLNHPEIKERRQKDICNKVKQLVGEGDFYYDSWLLSQETDGSAWKGYLEVLSKLLDMLHENSEYSAAAKATLKAYRNRKKHVWVRELLDAS